MPVPTIVTSYSYMYHEKTALNYMGECFSPLFMSTYYMYRANYLHYVKFHPELIMIMFHISLGFNVS